MIHGRCLSIQAQSITIRNESGDRTYPLSTPSQAKVGDIVRIQDGQAEVLTPCRKPGGKLLWSERILDPRRMRAMKIRSQVEAGIREFFLGRGFFETRTPLLVPSPGMEPHIRPFEVHSASGPRGRKAYLPTSPEFAMKRLLAGGLEKIFQLCSSFRDEPNSVSHRPEFMMLEWYRAYAGYEDIMRDTEEMFEAIARKLFGRPSLRFQGREISVAAPWPRLRIRDLFQEYAGVDLLRAKDAESLAAECRRLGHACDPARENWDDLYFKIWLNEIEPKLPSDRAVFVTRYPASQAALAVVDTDPDGSPWAKRFEVYAGGLELGNAFEELTDPAEQRARFVKDMNLRTEVYGDEFPKSPIDEGFLDALTEGMPPSGGIAMGVDRIAMLFADEPEIGYMSWLDPTGASS